MNLNKKIFVFRNSTEPVAEVNQFVAVSEDGFTLAVCFLAADMVQLYKFRMGNQSVYRRLYKKHYPKGYHLVFIDDINLPAYDHLRGIIQKTNRRRAEQREAELALQKLLDKTLSEASQVVEDSQKC